jgi:ubiquinone/menaquinone biosynthesis C-methylase UbiE
MNKKERITKNLYGDYAGEEWKRLEENSYFWLEYETTMTLLKKYLPKKGLILDAGGGPGRYTIALAKKGYNVVLLDLVPENLKIAKRQIKKEKVGNKVNEIVESSIVDLSKFKNNSFDAVICLGGPLSHVSPEKNRKKAISELIRVAKKDALIFISVMGKFGVLMNSLRTRPNDIKLNKSFENLYKNGEDNLWRKKGYCHFFTMEEFENLLKKENVKIIDKVGLEGIATSSRHITKELFQKEPQIKRNWLKMHYHTCRHPTVVDSSAHIMIITKKR